MVLQTLDAITREESMTIWQGDFIVMRSIANGMSLTLKDALRSGAVGGGLQRGLSNHPPTSLRQGACWDLDTC